MKRAQCAREIERPIDCSTRIPSLLWSGMMGAIGIRLRVDKQTVEGCMPVDTDQRSLARKAK
ncbi:hypothetical protein D3871_02675 [Noviherbaspirillum saxi]|uniref:Uncharacterized protein n=1 Tax=Noviherbaspirillum saxi TaxID=2320863 RepID=A0A3A3FMY9_9BURK|nr:hypothetical protein D3871_02675 [Noviherbaspirillum saxi]